MGYELRVFGSLFLVSNLELGDYYFGISHMGFEVMIFGFLFLASKLELDWVWKWVFQRELL
jgi:hypothetical protein